jgi:GNAT superfamily N-acetyltransferase
MRTLSIDRQNEEAFRPLMEPFFFDMLHDPAVIALGAAEGDAAVGALICRLWEDWIGLARIYVAPAFRGQGFGRNLLRRAVLQAMRQPDIEGVFAEYADTPENMPLNMIFYTCGFKVEAIQKSIHTIPLADVGRCDFWQKGRNDAHVLPLGKLSDQQWNAFQNEIAENDQQAAMPLSADRREYLNAPSVAYVRDDRVKGVLLMRKDEDALHLAYAHVLPGNGVALGSMLRSAGLSALAAYPPETPLCVTPVNESGEQIVEKLFPSRKKTPFRRAVLWTAGMAVMAAEAPAAQEAGYV